METFWQHVAARGQVLLASWRTRYARPRGMGHTGSNVGWIIGIVLVLALVITTLIPGVQTWATNQFKTLTNL